MNQIIVFLLCWALTATYAERPSWYPKNTDEILKNCYEETQLEPGIEKDLKNTQLINDPKVHAVFLCKAKGINIYSEDTGLNIDRLISSLYISTSDFDSKRSLAQDCVDKYKELASAGEMIFNVIKCIVENDDERMKNIDTTQN